MSASSSFTKNNVITEEGTDREAPVDLDIWVETVNEIITKPPWEGMYKPPPIELLPWLYISDEFHIRQVVQRYNALHITHVLTTNEMEDHQIASMQKLMASAGIRHLYVPGQDEEGYEMIGQYWNECYNFIQEAWEHRNVGAKVVIHCKAGINRSGLISAATMMVLEQKNLLDVVHHMKQKRGLVLSNLSFQRQLCKLAAKEGLLGKHPKK
eukprot:CAMPEP_0195262752 /NCGR_PEP_ID=MMETSP0706-20130129/9929_1 /TAXON_ID=33640 /ORGANISM="Asterionellopsis glacialis, Strain CCMP134" /LENGTH=210 /DNA_ID=CAMNT_0040316867 /DNA_START=70 /DNA_END=702 /DNA_ORIENTATION=+